MEDLGSLQEILRLVLGRAGERTNLSNIGLPGNVEDLVEAGNVHA